MIPILFKSVQLQILTGCSAPADCSLSKISSQSSLCHSVWQSGNWTCFQELLTFSGPPLFQECMPSLSRTLHNFLQGEVKRVVTQRRNKSLEQWGNVNFAAFLIYLPDYLGFSSSLMAYNRFQSYTRTNWSWTQQFQSQKLFESKPLVIFFQYSD